MDEKIVQISLLAATLIVLVVVYFFVVAIKQQRAIAKWQEARVKAEIETLESERKRIAEDLHDDIGPLLSTIRLNISNIETKAEDDQLLQQKSKIQIDDVIDKFRTISYNLLPNTLVRNGVCKAIEEFIERIEQPHLKIIFKGDKVDLNKRAQVNLFRIIQEIIHNTIKHSRATTLTIDILNKTNAIIVKTKDDGIGFTYNNKLEHTKSMGLLSIQSRVALLNGNLVVDTAVGLGTFYQIEIPIENGNNTN